MIESSRAALLDEESQRWIDALTADGAEQAAAAARLHTLLLNVARGETVRRAGIHGVRGPELDDLAHQAAGDAVMSILRKIEDFRGESRFTSWAYKFVVFEVSTKIARHAWRHDRVQLDEDAWSQLPERLGARPDDVAESRDLVRALQVGVESVLTPHQRHIFLAIIVQGIALDVLVAELGTNRNAIYKTLFDARRKLRAHLVAEGTLDAARGEVAGG